MCIVDESKEKYAACLKNYKNVIILNEVACIDPLTINCHIKNKIEHTITDRVCRQIDVNKINEWLSIRNTEFVATHNSESIISEFIKNQIVIIILNAHDFEFNIYSDKEFLLMINSFEKKYKDSFKIAYLTSTHLLQTYINNVENKSNVTIPVVSFISFIKNFIQLSTAIKLSLQKSNIPYIIINDLLYDLTKQAYIKFEKFTSTQFVGTYKPYVLNHHSIRNWDQLFNLLSKTEMNQYLK